jgi:hypothetical protein
VETWLLAVIGLATCVQTFILFRLLAILRRLTGRMAEMEQRFHRGLPAGLADLRATARRAAVLSDQGLAYAQVFDRHANQAVDRVDTAIASTALRVQRFADGAVAGANRQIARRLRVFDLPVFEIIAGLVGLQRGLQALRTRRRP